MLTKNMDNTEVFLCEHGTDIMVINQQSLNSSDCRLIPFYFIYIYRDFTVKFKINISINATYTHKLCCNC